MRVRVKQAAWDEIDEAAQRFEELRPGKGAEFSAAIGRAIDQIRDHPIRFARYEGGSVAAGYRRYHLNEYRHLIIYVVYPNEILVVAVAHTSREPGYWERRP